MAHLCTFRSFGVKRLTGYVWNIEGLCLALVPIATCNSDLLAGVSGRSRVHDAIILLLDQRLHYDPPLWPNLAPGNGRQPDALGSSSLGQRTEKLSEPKFGPETFV